MKHRVPSFNNSTSGRPNRKTTNTSKKYENVETIEPIDFQGRNYGKSSEDSFDSESEEENSSDRTSSTSEVVLQVEENNNNNNNIEQISSDEIDQQQQIYTTPPKKQHSKISELPRTNSIPKINTKTNNNNNNGRVMERQKSKSSQIHRNNSLTLDTGVLNTREQKQASTKPLTTSTTTPTNQLHKQTISSSHRANKTSTKTIAPTTEKTKNITSHTQNNKNYSSTNNSSIPSLRQSPDHEFDHLGKNAGLDNFIANSVTNLDEYALIDEIGNCLADQELCAMEPLPYGVLSRLAQQAYKNKKTQSCTYQHRNTMQFPLLESTVDVNAAERAWFYINTFLELDLNTIPIQTTSGAKQTIDLQNKNNNHLPNSSCSSSNSSSQNSLNDYNNKNNFKKSTSKGGDYKTPHQNIAGSHKKMQIPHLQNDDNLSVINSTYEGENERNNYNQQNNYPPSQHEAIRSGPHANSYASIIASKDPLELCQGLCLIGLSKVYSSSIKDELYCQLLKQINDNPDRQQVQNGWVLLALLCSSFTPSDSIKFYLKEFLDTCNDDFQAQAKYCTERLKECSKQKRENPPCSIELVAARLVTKCRIPVISMDQSIKTLICTPNLTAKELCALVSEKNRMKDSFGFSIFIALGSRFAPVGCGSVVVMDAICQAERYARANGINEVWRLYFRKDLFSPNYLSARHDTIALNLIFTQICGGVKVGEYECTTPQDLALLVAHQYCVQFPLFEEDSVHDGRLKEICEQTMPEVTYQKYRKQWHKMIKKTLEALKLEANTPGSQIPFSFHGGGGSDAPLNTYRSMSRSTTSSSEHDFGGMNTLSDSASANGIIDVRTKQINKIKEQVIKYAVMAWHDKFQRIYPINGCESYSLRGTLTQRWQGSGRIYRLFKKMLQIINFHEKFVKNIFFSFCI